MVGTIRRANEGIFSPDEESAKPKRVIKAAEYQQVVAENKKTREDYSLAETHYYQTNQKAIENSLLRRSEQREGAIRDYLNKGMFKDEEQFKTYAEWTSKITGIEEIGQELVDKITYFLRTDGFMNNIQAGLLMVSVNDAIKKATTSRPLDGIQKAFLKESIIQNKSNKRILEEVDKALKSLS